MHEVSIAQALVAAVEKIDRGNAATITAVHLRLGALTSIDPESLSFAFEIVSRKTIVAGALLTIERVPVVGRCRGCGWQGEAAAELGCPACGAIGVEVVQGRELELVAIEVSDP